MPWCVTGKFDDNFIADVEKVHAEQWFKLTGLPYPVPTTMSDGERRFLRFEPIPIWEKVRVPVLALWGEDDLSVPATKSKDLVGQALARAKNRDFTFRIFPHADHTLSIVRAPTDAWDFPRTAGGSRQVMGDWLLRRASLKNPTERCCAMNRLRAAWLCGVSASADKRNGNGADAMPDVSQRIDRTKAPKTLLRHEAWFAN